MCVFDIYRDMSIKNVERTLQDDDQGLQLQNISEKQRKKLLRQSYNKAGLIQFLLNVWKNKKIYRQIGGEMPESHTS